MKIGNSLSNPEKHLKSNRSKQYQIDEMDDLASSNEIVDLVYEVVESQVGRKKMFLEMLSKTLNVQGEYQVG